ncbi:MAG: DUF4886 domain-containing protein [Chthoniobacteraceae bacterium]
MNSSLLVRFAFVCIALAPFGLRAADPVASPTPRAELKLLTVGNSFTDNPTNLLPAFAKAGGKKLLLFKANLGGHSLEQHVGYLQAFEADPNDPKGHAYKQHADPRTGEKKDFSLKEALEAEPWDVVTIQQVSHKSYKAETYQPFAGTLIGYIKKNSPNAEIVVQETWAYGDDALVKFNQGKPVQLDQQTMYTGLKAAYGKLASDNGFRVLPVGDAFQVARAQGLVVNLPENIHANENGEYLGAAIWYEMLFGENVEAVNYVPAKLDPETAKTLRHIAHEAVTHSDFKTQSAAR